MALGVVAATTTAVVSGLSRSVINDGLFGFNGALIGAGLNVFLDPKQYWLVLIYIAIASVVSVPVMAASMTWISKSSAGAASPLTLPFNFITLICLTGLQMVRFSALPDDSEPDPEPLAGEINTAIRGEPEAEPRDLSVLLVLQILFRGLSQLFLIENAGVGLAILLGIAICSRASGIAAILGSAVGTLTAVAVGADGHSIYLGLFGYNGFVTAIAVAGVFVRLTPGSVLLGVLGSGVTSLLALGLQGPLNVIGMPFLTLPFCIVTIIAVLFAQNTLRLDVLPLSEVSTPEDHI